VSVYPAYAAAPNAFGKTPLNDQVFAGALMWVFGTFVYLCPRNRYGETALAPNSACHQSALLPKRSHESSRLIFAVSRLIRRHQSRHSNGNVQDADGGLQGSRHSRDRSDGNNITVT